MKEIGGYIELDTYRLPMLHDDAIALNCGRNALAYLIKVNHINHIWLPKLVCDSIIDICNQYGVSYSYYHIGFDFLPIDDVVLEENDWFYFVNFYSQFTNEIIEKYIRQYHRVIVDQAQSYFQQPIKKTCTIYTCRKYFGVADGAFLYTNSTLPDILDQDESYERMHFLQGRFERTASEFYEEYKRNNELFSKEPIKLMSKLTYNLLHAIDYEYALKRRENNYTFLQNRFGDINALKLSSTTGTFMYPLYLPNAVDIRSALQKQKIYIPVLWPNVLTLCDPDETEFMLAQNILPLPIDQRYGIEEMTLMSNSIQQLI